MMKRETFMTLADLVSAKKSVFLSTDSIGKETVWVFSFYLNKSSCLRVNFFYQSTNAVNLTTPCFVVCLFCFCVKESSTITPTRSYIWIKTDINISPLPSPPPRNTPVADFLIYHMGEEFDISVPWGILHHIGGKVEHLLNKLLQSQFNQVYGCPVSRARGSCLKCKTIELYQVRTISWLI